MPRGAWSAKDERQYKHVLLSCIKGPKHRGARGAMTCKRIAAATVNKRRSAEGRTLSGLEDTFKERMSNPWMLVVVGIIGYSAGRAIAKSEEAEAFKNLSNSYSKISALTTGTPLKGLNGCGCDY